MYTPRYLKDIQSDVKIIIATAEKALEKLEESAEYNDTLHPFHAAAVSTYNKLVTIAIMLDGLED